MWAYPTVVVIDKNGLVVDYVVGANEQRLMEAMEAALAGKPARTLEAPLPLSPKNGTVFDVFPRRTDVSWSEVKGASAYVVEWDFQNRDGSWATEPKGRGPQMRVDKPAATFTFGGMNPGRWRVWAVDPFGVQGARSPWSTFRYTR